MNPTHYQKEPELDALLAAGKPIEPLPDIVRARALSRARASVEQPVAIQLSGHTGRRRALSLAFAASGILLVGVAGAVVAVRTLAPPPSIPAPPPKSQVITPAPAASPEAPTPSVAPAEAASPTKRPARPAAASESYAAELELLQRAQAAYAGRNFTNALTVVAEHRRRFPNGRLAEEREALRVRALTGAGRPKEARAAASAFAERFPRSVLLPRLQPESQ
jgi:hypothetical protein